MTIEVEQLSKKYLIQNTRKVVDDTLKDRLTEGMKFLFNRFSKNSSKQEDTQEFWALKDLSFEIEQGDTLAIVGRNGAGKSTLLKIISRITPPTKGRVKIGGRVASLLEVGTGFHPELTGRENIYLNGALLGMSKQEIKKNFDEIVDFSEIEMFLDTPVKRYSSGMFVRLGFAVAAHLDPDILIIDEALAVGDATFKKKCLNKMEEIGKEGRTVIFVTHDMWALRFCNKGLLLHEGGIVPTRDLDHCIALYSGASSEVQEQKVWTGQCINDSVIIHHFELDDKGPGLSKVKIGVTLLEQAIDFYAGFYIYNQYGNKILHHKISHEKGISLSLGPGNYEFTSDIDLTIFSEGNYKLELDLGYHPFNQMAHPGICVSFDVSRPHKVDGEPPDTILTGWKGDYQLVSSSE